MNRTIPPIETKYAGVRFRSRLEARWAVFFDELGVSWEYEPESYRSSDGRVYIPDFRLQLRGRELHETSEGPHAFGGDDTVETFAEVKRVGGDFGKAIHFRVHVLPLPLEKLEGPPPGHPEWVRACAWHQQNARRHGVIAPARFSCPIDRAWDAYELDSVLRAASIACSARFGAYE